MIDQTYKVKSILGQGGSSRVLRWVDQNENHYALKVIKGNKRFSVEKVERMLYKEYFISEELQNHPNILKWLGSVNEGVLETESQGAQMIKYNILEVAQNGSLSRYIRLTGPWVEDCAKFLFWQVASAIKYMHDKNIAHFDVKLENILLDEYFNLKLADFGSAEIFPNKNSLFNYKKGTNWYMAPEVNHLSTSFSPFKADIYSLGVWLFLMLCGEFPMHTEQAFNSTDGSSEGEDIKSNDTLKMNLSWTQSSIIPELSSEWKDLLNNMIRISPSERFSIEEVLSHPWLSNLSLEPEIGVGSYTNSQVPINVRVYEEFNARKAFLLSEPPISE